MATLVPAGAGNRSTLHGEVSKVEGDNSGVQAGHLGERQIEKAVGYGGRRSIRRVRTGN